MTLSSLINRQRYLKLSPLMRQIFYFGTVGVTSFIVHFCVVYLLVSQYIMAPLYANVYAFLIAFIVSYLGHKFLTFTGAQQTLRLHRFFLVAISALALNESLYFLLLQFTPLNYLYALIIVLAVTPIYTFTMSRFWACR